jgi:transposase
VLAEQHAYRAMDLLVEADAQGAVQEAVSSPPPTPPEGDPQLNLEVDLVFFDATSTYFQRDDADDSDGESSSLRRYGHSKDHRRDLPQIVIGLAVTRQGIPVRCWTWPGGTNDQTVITEVKDGLRDWRLGRVVTVAGSGFSSEANQTYLKRAGGHYITGIKMRAGSRLADQALARQGRYQAVRDNLRVKEVRLDGDAGRRWIICHNPAEAIRDQARREEQLTAIREELERVNTELGRIHQVTLTGPAGSLQQTTRITDAQAKIFKDCGVSLPPKMSGLTTLE